MRFNSWAFTKVEIVTGSPLVPIPDHFKRSLISVVIFESLTWISTFHPPSLVGQRSMHRRLRRGLNVASWPLPKLETSVCTQVLPWFAQMLVPLLPTPSTPTKSWNSCRFYICKHCRKNCKCSAKVTNKLSPNCEQAEIMNNGHLLVENEVVGGGCPIWNTQPKIGVRTTDCAPIYLVRSSLLCEIGFYPA